MRDVLNRVSSTRLAMGLAATVVLSAGAMVAPGATQMAAAAEPVAPNTVTGFGSATAAGPSADTQFAAPLVTVVRAGDAGSNGYWVAAADGGVFSYGDAGFHGSLGGHELNSAVVGMASTPTGGGYWLTAGDGGVFAFGDAPFHGSLGGKALNSPIVAIAPVPTGGGYWLTAGDGGVFAFGDAQFLGAADAGALPAPVTGITASPDGTGYWLVGADGQVYPFGTADKGSPADRTVVNGAAAGIAAQSSGGYWVVHGPALESGPGESGPEVEAIQRRLTQLGYWLGPVNGTYGKLTTQAVFAFQKVEGLPVTGKVDGPTRQRIFTAGRPAPSSPAGDLVEIDKARQVLFVVRQGKVAFTFNTSTGTEKPYWFGGEQYRADTPTGRLLITHEVDGVKESRLGRLYRPKYFHPDGIAIHGYSFVPPYAASHGCVRVSKPAMDFLWSDDLAPVGTHVWVYGTTPPTPAD
ncbi:MAG: L,D-transpeptidase family protein [Acidimicrobiia bacterium]